MESNEKIEMKRSVSRDPLLRRFVQSSRNLLLHSRSKISINIMSR
jgi:hypothetical protein